MNTLKAYKNYYNNHDLKKIIIIFYKNLKIKTTNSFIKYLMKQKIFHNPSS